MLQVGKFISVATVMIYRKFYPGFGRERAHKNGDSGIGDEQGQTAGLTTRRNSRILGGVGSGGKWVAGICQGCQKSAQKMFDSLVTYWQ